MMGSVTTLTTRFPRAAVKRHTAFKTFTNTSEPNAIANAKWEPPKRECFNI
ncbi:hypothetical protein DPMN_185944 [Dreissena polymorpha]|uniref:Uncharacterized protein n=1 Tax=Dreissena polymorpha TaxID=45954 RepID=A0A9D4I8X2_DREPO|nr:hypothetical protein DPMN_185944 [Dreissena polymorpha]